MENRVGVDDFIKGGTAFTNVSCDTHRTALMLLVPQDFLSTDASVVQNWMALSTR